MNGYLLRSILLFTAIAVSTVAFGQFKFKDVTREAGLYEPLKGMMGHGGAFGDFDGDGRIDLYIGNFSDRPNDAYAPAKGPVANALFRNLGNGRFEQAKMPSVEFFARTSGAVFADLDNNGTLELFVANNCKRKKSSFDSGPQRAAQMRRSNLFRNDGSKLIDISHACGACPDAMGTARNVGVMDYNGDGLLDLLVLEDRFTRGPRSILFRNEGKLRFRDVNQEAGLPDDIFGLGLAVADLNGDLRPDFFVAHSNRMFLSAPGGKYYERPELNETFTWKPTNNEDWPCGAAFGDLNRDGRLDLVVGIHDEHARNRVYLNEGSATKPRFRDISKQVGLPAELPNKSPHVEIHDFDNDGWPDIYFSTAWLDKDGSVTPLIYRNLGDSMAGRLPLPKFAPIRPIKKADNIVYFPAGPTGDYDRDGRIDICLINWFRGNHTRLLHNESAPKNKWLQVQVIAKNSNRMGIGAQVRLFYPITSDDPLRGLGLGFQEVATGYGYASGQEAICHFGLGDVKAVDVEVTLPTGRKIVHVDVAANQRLVVEEQ
jgi:hypothetical protein